MTVHYMPSYFDFVERQAADEIREAAGAESDFYEELIDALNHNFVLEVEAGLSRDD